MPQPQDNARVFLFIILLIWFFSAPETNPSFISAPTFTSARLARQRKAFGVLNSTKWGDFSPRLAGDPDGTESRFLNLTGFREQDGFAWEDLGRFRSRCLEWSRNIVPVQRSDDMTWDLVLRTAKWQNATGVLSGEWVRRDGSVPRPAVGYDLNEMAPWLNWPGGHASWSRNVTGDHGKILLRVDDKDDSLEYEELPEPGQPRSGGLIREISAVMTVQDEASQSSSWDMRLHGVHWPRQGAILLASTSEKFAGIFGLPHLSPGPAFFQSSQTLLNQTLDKILRKKERTRFADLSNPWASTAEGPADSWSPAPQCEYVVYLQIQPVSLVDQFQVGYLQRQYGLRSDELIQQIEDELRHPTGAPTGGTPPLSMSFVAWSPDCSFHLESKGPPEYASAEGEHLVGMKEEVLVYGAKVWLLAFAGILFAQVQLLKGQMKESSTPSTMGRVSFYTAGIMLLADGLTFAVAAAWSLSPTNVFLHSLVLTFASFMSMIIGSVFMTDVYKIQEPERRNRRRQREQTANANANTTRAPPTSASSAATADTLPLPVTAGPPRPATPPIIIPSDQDIDAEIAENTAAGAAALPVPIPGATNSAANRQANADTNANANATPGVRLTPFSSITGRFLLLGTFILFLSLMATSWPSPIRSAYVNTLAFIYVSLWVPQIWRNVQRNSRRALAWRFMIGQSILRLAPFAYFYLRRDNILFATPDPFAFTLLAGWLWVQLWVLAFQDVLGPRFGIPKSWTPEAWDYHPVLREDSVEAGGLPIGLLAGTGSAPGSPVRDRASSISFGPDVGEGGGGARRRERDKERERKGTYLRSVDCAICREVLEVPVVRAGAEDQTGGGVAGLLQRRAYMVTPCRHIFHAPCLEGWLRYRLQCPICREELPPL